MWAVEGASTGWPPQSEATSPIGTERPRALYRSRPKNQHVAENQEKAARPAGSKAAGVARDQLYAAVFEGASACGLFATTLATVARRMSAKWAEAAISAVALKAWRG